MIKKNTEILDGDNYDMIVIVPNYNNGIYITECIDSIINQKTNYKFCVLITDDASKDDSVKIIEQYLNNNLNIAAIFKTKNEGLFLNYLGTLDYVSRFKYFCLLDPDDYFIDKSFFQTGIDFLEHNSEFSIYGQDCQFVFPDGKKWNYFGIEKDVEITSYLDFVKSGKVYATTTSIYRNAFRNKELLEKFKSLSFSPKGYAFRSETARHLIHLMYGESYYEQKVAAIFRKDGSGVWSSMSDSEKSFTMAYSFMCYYEFFGEDYLQEYYWKIKNAYDAGLRYVLRDSVNGKEFGFSDKMREWVLSVGDWLNNNKNYVKSIHRPMFSLLKYDQIKNADNLILWGTGKLLDIVIDKYNINVSEKTIYTDNDASKWWKELYGGMIVPPSEIRRYDSRYLLMANQYYDEIYEQIISDNLFPLDHVVNVFDFEKYWIDAIAKYV